MMKVLLVSPRKSGTHLFQKLLETKIRFQGRLEVGSDLEGFYSLSNTFHTSFSQYFNNLDRNDFTGGKLVPIASSLGIVISRHPLDVLLSHLEFSFTSGNTCFANLNFTNLADKLDFVLSGDFYEDFFKEHYDYTAWSRLDNFITVSYEDAISSLQTEGDSPELQGSMNDFHKHFVLNDMSEVYGNSATFNEGKIGRGLTFFKEHYPEVFENKYYIKYCDFYGYSTTKSTSPTKLVQLNDKTINLNDLRIKDTPLLVQENYLDYRIIYYNGLIYGFSHTKNFFKELALESVHCVGKSIKEVQGLISADVIFKKTKDK